MAAAVTRTFKPVSKATKTASEGKVMGQGAAAQATSEQGERRAEPFPL